MKAIRGGMGGDQERLPRGPTALQAALMSTGPNYEETSVHTELCWADLLFPREGSFLKLFRTTVSGSAEAQLTCVGLWRGAVGSRWDLREKSWDAIPWGM